MPSQYDSALSNRVGLNRPKTGGVDSFSGCHDVSAHIWKTISTEIITGTSPAPKCG